MNHGMLPIRIEKPSHNLPIANTNKNMTWDSSTLYPLQIADGEAPLAVDNRMQR